MKNKLFKIFLLSLSFALSIIIPIISYTFFIGDYIGNRIPYSLFLIILIVILNSFIISKVPERRKYFYTFIIFSFVILEFVILIFGNGYNKFNGNYVNNNCNDVIIRTNKYKPLQELTAEDAKCLYGDVGVAQFSTLEFISVLSFFNFGYLFLIILIFEIKRFIKGRMLKNKKAN